MLHEVFTIFLTVVGPLVCSNKYNLPQCRIIKDGHDDIDKYQL